MPKIKYNRIRILLAERDRNATWLAEQIGVSKMAVSRWCNNVAQPRIPVLYQVAKILDVSVYELLVEDID